MGTGGYVCGSGVTGSAVTTTALGSCDVAIVITRSGAPQCLGIWPATQHWLVSLPVYCLRSICGLRTAQSPFILDLFLQPTKLAERHTRWDTVIQRHIVKTKEGWPPHIHVPEQTRGVWWCLMHSLDPVSTVPSNFPSVS